MVQAYLQTATDHYLMTDGYLPDMQQLELLAPQAPKDLVLKEFDFDTREDAAAWVLGTMARRTYALSMKKGINHRTIDIHSWIIGPPDTADARFAKWFIDKEPDYCLALHSSPNKCTETGRIIKSTPFSINYRKHSGKLNMGQRGTRLLRQEMQQDLDNLILEASNSKEALTKLMDCSGHPYWYSNAIPQ